MASILLRTPSPLELGRMGERRAVWFYRLRGYRVADRNVRSREGEIDLILRRGRTLVVAEVKTRSSTARGEPSEAVDRAKQLRLVRLAERYLLQHPDPAVRLRFDVISLLWTGWRFRVTAYPDAFRPLGDPVRPWKWV